MEKQKLPNALAVLILGIISMVTCCLYSIGLVFAIIALVLAKKDTTLYLINPDEYDNYSILNTGKILAIIGIVLNVVFFAFMVGMFVLLGDVLLSGDQQAIKEAMENAMGK